MYGSIGLIILLLIFIYYLSYKQIKVRHLLILGFYVNWFLGAIALAIVTWTDKFYDMKKFWITFIFGLYGYLLYVYNF